jgi:FkbM family methyltransferase
MLASNIRTATCRYGDISYYADDQFIGHGLEKYGEYSEAEIALWRQIIKPGWTVLDVGANIGALTLPLAKLVGPKGQVFAFEPQPENYALLQKNIEQNQLESTVTTYDCALGAGQTTIRVPPLASLGHNNYGGFELHDNDFGDQVAIRPLDSLVLDAVHFMKVDVEGSEADVLRGAKDTIQRFRPILYVEADRRDKAEELMLLIRSMNYYTHEHLPPLFNPSNFRGNPQNDFGNIVSINVLCIPVEQIEQWAYITRGMKALVPASPRVGKTGWAGVARMGGVGDNLIAASVLRPLKEMGYKVEVISQLPHSVLYENNPYIDKLSVYGENDWKLIVKNMGDAFKWFAHRAKEYDLFANLSMSCEYLCVTPMANAPFWWPQEFRRKLFGRSYIESVHDIFGLPHTFGPLFFPTDEEKEQALATRNQLGPGPVIGWCMSGTRVDKVYPPAPYVMARLIRELGATVVMLAGPPPLQDFPLCQQAMEMVAIENGTMQGLVHAASPSMEQQTWPIRRILSFAMTACDLVIGPDTGPMWGVAFEQVPKILLLSHASAENIAKHWVNTTVLHADPARVPCWPCHQLHDSLEFCHENKWKNGAACISDIQVGTIVATAAMSLLNRGGLRAIGIQNRSDPAGQPIEPPAAPPGVGAGRLDDGSGDNPARNLPVV